MLVTRDIVILGSDIVVEAKIHHGGKTLHYVPVHIHRMCTCHMCTSVCEFSIEFSIDYIKYIPKQHKHIS